MRRKRREIAEGQRYRKLGPGGCIWEVVSLRRDGMGTAHALMKRSDGPKTLKTLSVSALLDSDSFEPVGDDA